MSAVEEFLSQYDRAEIKNDSAFFATLKRLWDITDENCIPAIVTEYDKETNKVTVLPLVKRVFENAKGAVFQDRPEVKVNVYQLRHGGFRVHCPIFRGDTGYLIACDRYASNVIDKNSNPVDKPQEVIAPKDEGGKEGENEGSAAPDNFMLKDFAAGFFLPCSWVKPELGEKLFNKFVIGVIGSEEKDDAYITFDGDDGIEIHADHSIKIVAPTVESECDEFVVRVKDIARFLSKNLEIKDEKRKVEIAPDRDLKKTDARFREVTIVTGYEKDPENEKKVKLLTKKICILSDESEDGKSIEFETGGGAEINHQFYIKIWSETDQAYKVLSNTGVASNADINVIQPNGNNSEIQCLQNLRYTGHTIVGDFITMKFKDGSLVAHGTTSNVELIQTYEETTY